MSARVLLALDVGDARIGVAISRSAIIAEPLCTIERAARKQTLDEIEGIVRRERVTEMVVGLPTREDGTAGDRVEKTEAFVRSLKRRIPGLLWHFQDERYSTVEAAEIRPDARGVRGGLDRLAAAVILRDFLARRVVPPGDASSTT